MHTLLALLNVNGEFVQYLCLYFLGDVRCTQMESATCGIRVNNNINKDMMPEATDDSFWLLHFHYLPVCHIRYKADLLDSRGLCFYQILHNQGDVALSSFACIFISCCFFRELCQDNCWALQDILIEIMPLFKKQSSGAKKRLQHQQYLVCVLIICPYLFFYILFYIHVTLCDCITNHILAIKAVCCNMLQYRNLHICMIYVYVGTVKPVMRDYCHERPPVLNNNIFPGKGLIFQCNWTCLSNPHFNGQWSDLSIQVLLTVILYIIMYVLYICIHKFWCSRLLALSLSCIVGFVYVSGQRVPRTCLWHFQLWTERGW